MFYDFFVCKKLIQNIAETNATVKWKLRFFFLNQKQYCIHCKMHVLFSIKWEWKKNKRRETSISIQFAICTRWSKIKYDMMVFCMFPIDFYWFRLCCDISFSPSLHPFDPQYGWLYANEFGSRFFRNKTSYQQQEQEHRQFYNISSVTIHAVHFSHASKYHP